MRRTLTHHGFLVFCFLFFCSTHLVIPKDFINKETQPCDKVTADSEQTVSRLSRLCAQVQVKPGHAQALFYAAVAGAGGRPRRTHPREEYCFPPLFGLRALLVFGADQT